MAVVLLLDDDVDFRRLAAEAIERHGHTVRQAESGEGATKLLESREVDLAVVDGLLPDTDGLRWIRQARAQGFVKPLIAISAFWRDDSARRALEELGVSQVLFKPVLPSVLAERVDSLARGESPVLEETSVDAAFRALRHAYVRALPGKIDELERAIGLAQACEPGSLEAAQGQAHRLRGTAGAYGCPGVGEAAGRVEEVLKAGASGEGREALERALAGARREVQLALALVEDGLQASGAASGYVLAVGADPGFRNLLAARGASLHREVLALEDQELAVQHAKARPPDAVFLDLPQAPAFELAMRLRALPGCESVPLALLSETDASADRSAAAVLGAALCLRRPLGLPEIDAAARQLLALPQRPRPRVLLVDDDPDFAQHAAAVLERRGIAATVLAEPRRLLEVLDEVRPDLAIIDVVLPNANGYALCRSLRANPRWQELPLVVVTAKTGIDARLAAFQAGADDYLSKPIVEEELLARVEVRLERARLVREKYDKDGLTGLSLRRPFVEAMRSRLSEALRQRRPVALALLDLDRFKQVNDEHGHLAGDEVLQALGKLLLRRFRGEDLRCRWGGEEFVLALAGENAETMQGALHRLLEELSALVFEGEKGESFHVSFSAGVACFPDDGQRLEELIRIADRRLYGAKAAGRHLVNVQG